MTRSPNNRTIEKGPGRPTTYDPALGEKIVALMEQGLSLAAAAAECDVHRRRVYDWEAAHADFAELVALGRVKRQAYLERRLLDATIGATVTSSIFALKNAAPDDWREKSEFEHTGRNGGPIKHADATAETLLEEARRLGIDPTTLGL